MDSTELTNLKLDILKLLEQQPPHKTFTAARLAYLLNEEKEDSLEWETMGDSDAYLTWKNHVRLALSILRRQDKVTFYRSNFRNTYYYSQKPNAYSPDKPE